VGKTASGAKYYTLRLYRKRPDLPCILTSNVFINYGLVSSAPIFTDNPSTDPLLNILTLERHLEMTMIMIITNNHNNNNVEVLYFGKGGTLFWQNSTD
jgi:hypothetical protein